MMQHFSVYRYGIIMCKQAREKEKKERIIISVQECDKRCFVREISNYNRS